MLADISMARASCRLDWPLRGRVTRGFEKAAGAYGEGGHQGIDIAGTRGSTVRAAADGTVSWTGELPRGRLVTLSHGGSAKTTYLGLEAISVSQGDRVRVGQPVGTLEGTRDPSSAQTHLHFDAYLGGTPVDPRLLMGDFDAGSFIRLCPVDRQSASRQAPGAISTEGDGGLLQSVIRPFKSALKAMGGGVEAIWGGVSAAADWVAGGIEGFWDGAIFPAFRKLGHWISAGARWCWNNRYVKAIVAGLAAAVVIVLVVIVVVITLPVSLTVGVIAGIAATVACLGMAVYFAATHPEGFTFMSCFFKCLSAGAAVAATVVSMGSLGAAFSAGWAEMGLVGALKCAAGNGLLSMIFEGSTSYLFTGHMSVKRMAIAFAVGAISGPVSKAVKDGIVGSRLVQALIINVSEGGTSIASRTAVLFLQKSGEALHGMLTLMKDGATAFGGKAVYVLFTGTFGVSTNIISCMLNHKPITLSGMFASFLTGLAMGGLGLAFGGKGLDGLFSKVGFLKEGFGRIVRKGISKLVNKSISKSLNGALRSKFSKLLHEQETVITEEEL